MSPSRVSFTVTPSSASLPVLSTVIVYSISSPNGTDSGQDLVTSMPGSCVMSVVQDASSEASTPESAPVPVAVTVLVSGSGSPATGV